MKTFRKLLLTLLLIPVLLLGGCGFPGLGGSGNDGTVRIASQTSTESQIMANIIAELINHELGYKTTLVNNLGSGTVVHQAMIRNDADQCDSIHRHRYHRHIRHEPCQKSFQSDDHRQA